MQEKLSDVATKDLAENIRYPLDHVGMENIETLVLVNGQKLPAVVHAGVSLTDAKARGIHMSRLFRIATRLAEQEFSWEWLHSRTQAMKESHAGLSDSVHLRVQFDLPVLRPSLLSSESGWRTYPVVFEVTEKKGERRSRMDLKVLYSSTCPCSASLSQQALREAFADTFKEDQLPREKILNWLNSSDSVVAVPHAQRSEARVELLFAPGRESLDPLPFINLMEMSLGTPVQTAVKREDEQEFARLNAQNLMFCEDAARKLKAALLKRDDLQDFNIEVRHFESLHPHDVVARVSRL